MNHFILVNDDKDEAYGDIEVEPTDLKQEQDDHPMRRRSTMSAPDEGDMDPWSVLVNEPNPPPIFKSNKIRTSKLHGMELLCHTTCSSSSQRWLTSTSYLSWCCRLFRRFRSPAASQPSSSRCSSWSWSRRFKDLFEDLSRHRSDNEENDRKILVADRATRTFLTKKWRDVKVGDIVKVLENRYFPADIVLLNSSAPKGIAYIETKNLDGETNLKHKNSNKNILDLCPDEGGHHAARGQDHRRPP